jgi:hydrogenase maturation protease
MPDASTTRALVIGIGNDLRQDDGVGLVVARRLKACAIDGVEILEHDGEATSLLEAWECFQRIAVVDAMWSGAAAGTILRMDAHGPGIARGVWHSSHSPGLAEAISLARTLGRLPPALVVYGIEGQAFGYGRGLSPAVENAACDAVRQLVVELNPAAHRQ